MKPNYVKFYLDEPAIMDSLNSIITIADKINIRFDPMEPQQLHMTVVFLGNIMKGMLKQDREELIKIINNFDLGGDELFTFNGYEFFGNKKNLLIAKYSAKKSVINKIIEFKKKFYQYGAIDEDFFVPHITLGKISSTSMTESFSTMITNIYMPTLNLNKVLLV